MEGTELENGWLEVGEVLSSTGTPEVISSTDTVDLSREDWLKDSVEADPSELPVAPVNCRSEDDSSCPEIVAVVDDTTFFDVVAGCSAAELLLSKVVVVVVDVPDTAVVSSDVRVVVELLEESLPSERSVEAFCGVCRGVEEIPVVLPELKGEDCLANGLAVPVKNRKLFEVVELRLLIALTLVEVLESGRNGLWFPVRTAKLDRVFTPVFPTLEEL